MPRKNTLAARLGARIVALRAEAGLTQEALAWEAEFGSKGYMSRIESGERAPSLAVLERLADCLGVEVRDLFIFPEDGLVEQAMERLRVEGDNLAAIVLAPEEPPRRPTPSTTSSRTGKAMRRPRPRRT